MTRVLQIGFGNFGPTHLQAWRSLGLADSLFVVDPSPEARARVVSLGIAPQRIGADIETFLADVDVVDVLAPTDLHADICARVLAAGKPMFVEKPMVSTLAEAERLAQQAAAAAVVVQVGFYFRYHPLARMLMEEVSAGTLGDLRYLSARFHGPKRLRADSGVVQNDGVHFIDQANWIAGAIPATVDADVRDHFDRGLEDFALIRLDYRDGPLAQIEVGAIQPGDYPDDIVPGAVQTKSFTVAGSEGAIEIDYMTGVLRQHKVRHELIDGLYRPVNGGVREPVVARVEPWQVVAAELEAFLDAVSGVAAPVAGVEECGVAIARVLDAVYRSSAQAERITL
jgi:predicted dehydrogenase